MANAYHMSSSDPDLVLITVLIRGEATKAGKDLPVAQSAEGQPKEITLAERLDKLEAYRTSDLRGREQLEGRRQVGEETRRRPDPPVLDSLLPTTIMDATSPFSGTNLLPLPSYFDR